MRAIVGAYDCAPVRGSEAGVGWNWVVQIARGGIDVHVVTASRNRDAIESALGLVADLPLTFHFLETPKAVSRVSTFWGWNYYGWQLALGRYARRLHREQPFDVAHHLTWGTDWMPSGLASLPIPFIWGPVGGSSHKRPYGVDLDLSPEAVRTERTRAVLQRLVKSADPNFRRTIRRADRILTYTDEARDGISARHRSRAESLTHIGVSPSDLPTDYVAERSAYLARVESGTTGPLRVITGGRLVHWKGFDLLLEGLAQHRRTSGEATRLTITSSSQQGSRGLAMIAELIERNGLADAVEVVGHLPRREDVYTLMAGSDLYALPTWRDGPPTALLEAMHGGLPVLVLDIGATRELVPEGMGFKIPVEQRAQIVEGIASALDVAAADRQQLAAMGEAARSHAVAYHSWDRIGAAIRDVYRDVVRPEPAPRIKSVSP